MERACAHRVVCQVRLWAPRLRRDADSRLELVQGRRADRRPGAAGSVEGGHRVAVHLRDAGRQMPLPGENLEGARRVAAEIDLDRAGREGADPAERHAALVAVAPDRQAVLLLELLRPDAALPERRADRLAAGGVARLDADPLAARLPDAVRECQALRQPAEWAEASLAERTADELWVAGPRLSERSVPTPERPPRAVPMAAVLAALAAQRFEAAKFLELPVAPRRARSRQP